MRITVLPSPNREGIFDVNQYVTDILGTPEPRDWTWTDPLREGTAGIVRGFRNSQIERERIQSLIGLDDNQFREAVRQGRASPHEAVLTRVSQDERDRALQRQLDSWQAWDEGVNDIAQSVAPQTPYRAPEGVLEKIGYTALALAPQIVKEGAKFGILGPLGTGLWNTAMGNREAQQQVYTNLRTQGRTPEQALDAVNDANMNVADMAVRGIANAATMGALGAPINTASNPILQTLGNIGRAAAYSGIGSGAEHALTNYRSNIPNTFSDVLGVGAKGAATTAGVGLLNALLHGKRLWELQREYYRNRPIETTFSDEPPSNPPMGGSPNYPQLPPNNSPTPSGNALALPAPSPAPSGNTLALPEPSQNEQAAGLERYNNAIVKFGFTPITSITNPMDSFEEIRGAIQEGSITPQDAMAMLIEGGISPEVTRLVVDVPTPNVISQTDRIPRTHTARPEQVKLTKRKTITDEIAPDNFNVQQDTSLLPFDFLKPNKSQETDSFTRRPDKLPLDINNTNTETFAPIDDKLSENKSFRLPPITAQPEGNNTARVRTMRGTEADVRYRVVDADDLITSTNERGTPNPEYPQELQPRQRDREASLAQISRISGNIDPELLAEDRLVSNGAPIVGPDMVVESGNGRVMALRHAYNTGKAKEYRNWLLENAGRFGLNTRDFSNMEKPVLVRVRTSDVDRVRFASEANESSIASMSPTENAQEDARRITPEILMSYDVDKTLPANHQFLNAFLGTIPPTERASLLQRDGTISRAGIERAQNALTALAYGDNSVLNRLNEIFDDDIKNVSNALIQAAPSLALFEHSGRRPEISLQNDIAQAVNTLANIREEGRTVEEYLAQPVLFKDDDMTREAKTLLRFFDGNKRSAKAIAQGLINYANMASREVKPRQKIISGLGNSVRRKGRLLHEALGGSTPEVHRGDLSTSRPNVRTIPTTDERLQPDNTRWGQRISPSMLRGTAYGAERLLQPRGQDRQRNPDILPLPYGHDIRAGGSARKPKVHTLPPDDPRLQPPLEPELLDAIRETEFGRPSGTLNAREIEDLRTKLDIMRDAGQELRLPHRYFSWKTEDGDNLATDPNSEGGRVLYQKAA